MTESIDHLRRRVTARSTDFEIEMLAEQAVTHAYSKADAVAYLTAARRVLRNSPDVRQQGTLCCRSVKCGGNYRDHACCLLVAGLCPHRRGPMESP